MTSAEGRGRRAYIDWARGIAVLLMIEAHTFDAWTRAADRDTISFRNATILGGFAAPLFLWLAGVSVALAAPRYARRAGDTRWIGANAVCRRGLELFVLAFVFRLQAFILSPGNSLLSLFRVDILNVMGPAIAVAALVWGMAGSTRRRMVAFGALAIAVALTTPIVRAAQAVDDLPVWVQWYARPSGEHTTFTVFPWAGFVFAGAAVGVLIASLRSWPATIVRGTGVDASRRCRRERQLVAAIAVAGAAVLMLGCWTATRPSIYASSSFWTTSPTYFAVRVGAMMIALSLLFALETALGGGAGAKWLEPLAILGRQSLFVYWIHVELVYGYVSWGWTHALPIWGTCAGFAVFSALMYGTVVIRDRVAARGGGRPNVGPAAAAA